MGVVGSGGQCQMVIGNDVIEVCDKILKPGTFTGGTPAPAAREKRERTAEPYRLLTIHPSGQAFAETKRQDHLTIAPLHRKHTGC